MFSERSIEKKVGQLSDRVKKTAASNNPWKGIDRVQQFLVARKDALQTHPELLQRVHAIHQQQAYQVALNLHAISKSLCLNLDQLEKATENTTVTSHLHCINFVNQTQQFIIKDIVKKKNICERTLRMEFWVAVLENVFKMGDIQAAVIILTALDNPILKELKATHQGLSIQAQRIIKDTEQFVHGKRSLMIAERAAPIVPAFDFYMYHFEKTKHHPQFFAKYKNELEKLQAELQFTLIKKITDNIVDSEAEERAECIEYWIDVCREAYEQQNYRKALIILNAINADEVKNLTGNYIGVSVQALYTLEEIVKKMRAQPARFESRHFVNFDVNDSQPMYFEYERFTETEDAARVDGNAGSSKGKDIPEDFDEKVSKTVRQLEQGSMKSSPIIKKYYPNLFFSDESGVELNAKIKNRLQQHALQDEIMKINGGPIHDNLRELEKYTRKKLNMFARKRKKKVGALLERFAQVRQYVSESAEKGVIPDLDDNLHYLEKMLADPIVNPAAGKPDKVVRALNALKEAMIATKNMAAQQEILQRQYMQNESMKIDACMDLMATLSGSEINFVPHLDDSWDMSTQVIDLSPSVSRSSVAESSASVSSACVPNELPPSDILSGDLTPSDNDSLTAESDADISLSDQPVLNADTKKLVNYFERKAKRDSWWVLDKIKEQRKPVTEEIQGIKLFSVFSNRPANPASAAIKKEDYGKRFNF